MLDKNKDAFIWIELHQVLNYTEFYLFWVFSVWPAMEDIDSDGK